MIFIPCWSLEKGKSPLYFRKKARQVSEGKVRLFHQQNELSELTSLDLIMQGIITESRQFFW